jgi:hypothetical protein
VNWADFPTLVPLWNGDLAAHWLELAGESIQDGYSFRVAASTDGGASWGDPQTLVSKGPAPGADQGFVSIVPYDEGRFAVLWLDGRANAPGAGHGTQSLRAALSSGGRFGADTVVDELACDCCQTSAVAVPGGLLAAYRDRTNDELRDISLVRFDGERWSPPTTLHADGWTVSGCPVNGPALASRGPLVAAAWFTAPGAKKRMEAGDPPQGRVFASFSKDAGRSFGAPVRVDEGDPEGRVDVELLPDGSAAVSWLEAKGGKTDLVARRLTPAGKRRPVLTVAESSRARATGFARMTLLGSDLLIAWTEVGGGPTRVRIARIAPE